MAEIVGILGVSIQLFTNCIHGYKYLLAAKERNEDSMRLVTKLQIQEVRLKSWGTYWGFTEGKVRDDLAEDEATLRVVVKTFEQIKAVAEDTAGLSKRYGLEAELEAVKLNEIVKGDPGDLIQGTDKKRKRGTGLSELSSKLKRGCSWAIVDKEKFEGLVKDMTDFNDGLYHMTLPLKERRSLTQAVVSAFAFNNSSTTQSQSQSDQQWRQLQTASAELTISSIADDDSNRGKTSTGGAEPYTTLEAVASFRLRSTSPSQANLQITQSSVVLHTKIAQLAAKHGEPAIALYNDSPVLVEWRSISQTPGAMQRVARMASLLALSPKPATFRVLDLTGYYEDASTRRLCFISRLPPSLSSSSLPPISLYNLIARSATTSVPSLGDRFRLSQALVASCLYLHAGGWLHRRIRSNTVLFFRGGENPVLQLSQIDLSQPYMTGFGYAYPDGFWMQPSVASRSHHVEEHDYYRHPDSMSARVYRSVYDVFSLGLVLLEIGLWTRLCSLRTGKGTVEVAAFLKEIRKSHVPRLGYKCGDIYQKVVERCLDATDRRLAEGGDDDFWGWEEQKKREQEWFYWDVVRELEKCCA